MNGSDEARRVGGCALPPERPTEAAILNGAQGLSGLSVAKPFPRCWLELCLRSKTEPWDFILAWIPSSKAGPHTCWLSKVAFWPSKSRSVSLPDSLARAPVWDSRGLMNCNLQSSGTASQKEMSTLPDLGINVLLKSLPCKDSEWLRLGFGLSKLCMGPWLCWALHFSVQRLDTWCPSLNICTLPCSIQIRINSSKCSWKFHVTFCHCFRKSLAHTRTQKVAAPYKAPTVLMYIPKRISNTLIF